MILPFSVEDWPRDALDSFLERAAIVEFDAHRSRKEAERLAEQMTRDAWALK